MESAREYLTEERIYHLAYGALLNDWGREHDYLERLPDNEIQQERERIAWDRMETLQKMAEEKGYKI